MSSEAKKWRAESAERLRAAMADGTHEARARFGEWYRWRVYRSIESRVVARPFAFEGREAMEQCFADLQKRWIARHERLCSDADLDAEMARILAASAIARVFRIATQRMGLAPESIADVGVLD